MNRRTFFAALVSLFTAPFVKPRPLGMWSGETLPYVAYDEIDFKITEEEWSALSDFQQNAMVTRRVKYLYAQAARRPWRRRSRKLWLP